MFQEDAAEDLDDAPVEAARNQLDEIAKKVQQPRSRSRAWIPQSINVPALPDGSDDWSKWSELCVEYLTPLNSTQRAMWLDAHKDILSEGEMLAYEQVADLLQLV
jgi:hypothetical protein